ncbi:hypothetical protein ANN_26932 [Periplaneta americana]|uniref:G-protein coupled receptors family 1 profile domain-containing protein n=1 Tax=Periplaneta americana TaxID=6978 RepID=A0ABQ8RWR8_PERAM|nr:hypothetical protein ANN_26932 [Periplaneta americana]
MEFNITNVTHVATNVTHVATCARQIGPVAQLVFTVMYITGVLGNMAALSILYRSEKQMRNKKIILMLRCLASNDLVALVGMLILMYLQMYLPEEHACSHEFCVARVIWRHFGLSSGCVAMVMAIERWLALTHPFLYQKVSFKI